MTPRMLVDVGNSRLKWGQYRDGYYIKKWSLPLDDLTAWDQAVKEVTGIGTHTWAIGSVNPGATEKFLAWLLRKGESFLVLNGLDISNLNISTKNNATIGTDRLMNALAAKHLSPSIPTLIVIDIGTATTVDLVTNGEFVGGAILPGPRLLGRSLHQYTAKLPDIGIDQIPDVVLPGKTTEEAIQLGIASCLIGGLRFLVEQMTLREIGRGESSALGSHVVITGGAAGQLSPTTFEQIPGVKKVMWAPNLTLDGIRLAAEALP